MENREVGSADQPEIPLADKAVPVSLAHFSYAAQTDHGLRLTGTIEAPDGATAIHLLEGMRLRVVEVAVAKAAKGPAKEPVRDEAFLAFNQRLWLLARSGLPVETSLRMAAANLQRGRLARAIASIADEIKQGVPLADAFEKHRRQFPPLYGRLIDAGVHGGNLPDMLLELGPHLESQRRLSAALWRSIAYPLMMLAGLLIVLSFIGWVVVPRVRSLLIDQHIEIPPVSMVFLDLGFVAPYLAAGCIGLLAIGALIWAVLRASKAEEWAADRLMLRWPVVGPVLKLNLVARWLAAARIGVSAGLDLPAAIMLAGDVIASPALRRDSAELLALLAACTPLSAARGRLLPTTVPTALGFASSHDQLPNTLAALSDLYARLARLRMERIPALLMPMLVIVIALSVTFVGCGILWPLFLMIREVTNMVKF